VTYIIVCVTTISPTNGKISNRPLVFWISLLAVASGYITTQAEPKDTSTMADETNNTSSSSKRKHKRTNNRCNSNKRRKKSNASTNQRRKNWIESCSESIHRIPVDSTAPICCIVTRVELEEERLLPKVVLSAKEVDVNDLDSGHDDDDAHQNEKCVSGSSKAVVVQGDEVHADDSVKIALNDGADDSTRQHEPQTQADGNGTSQIIATLKTDPVDSDAPFRMNGEEKKIFIPVKRDASAIGPTQVRQATLQSSCTHHDLA
jgi:hypothetical protein